jgi:hypothetical protein
MLTNMTASTAAIDPRMAWCDDTYLNTPTLVPSNEDNSHTRDVYGHEQYPNEFYSPFSSTIQIQSTPKTSERLPYPMPFDWTPEGRNLNSPPSWMANQSTPTRMSNKTRQSLPLFCDDGNGHTFASNSPHSAIDFQPTSMSMISPTNTHPNIIAYTPRRASGPAAFASMNALQPQAQIVSTKTHEGHPNAIKANESCRMPPPPVPKHAHRKSLLPTKTQHRLSEELYAKLAEQHSTQLLPIFDGRNCDQTQPKTLPPQYRALYNASTVGPTQYAREVVTSKSVKRSSLTQNVLLQTIFNKKIVNKIASHLTETDALSFALSSPSIYHRLDDEWWKTTFPVRDEEQSKKSAWVYLWPQSHGWCSFCTRWKRIVMHEPSKAHVCFECMQLPHFKVVSFSAARSRFKVGNSVAIHFFSQLPSVQDGKARYFWICHLQWVEAQCRIMDAALELIKNKPIMCKSNKERSYVKPSGGTSKRSRKRSVSHSALPKEKKAKKVNQDDTFEDPQSGKSDVSNESKDDIDTTYCDDSSDLTSFDGLDDEDAEGDTDDEYIPESRAERKAYNVTRKRAKSPAKIVVEPRTRSRTFTGPFSNRECRNSATIRNRRAKSSPAPSDMPQSRDGEDEEHDESVYICTSNERSMSIVREVRREYIVKELEAIEGCPNTQFEIPDMFVQGQWDVMEKLGIQHNDWNAMATWIIRKSTLKEGIRAEELD